MRNTGHYLQYSDKQQLKDLDKNTYPADKVAVFPLNMYGSIKNREYNQDVAGPKDMNWRKTWKKENKECHPNEGPVQYPWYLYSRPRDLETDYVIHSERDTHPQHFSRFAYPYFANGYGFGNFPGRYNTPPSCGYPPWNWQDESSEYPMSEVSEKQPGNMAPSRLYNLPNNVSTVRKALYDRPNIQRVPITGEFSECKYNGTFY